MVTHSATVDKRTWYPVKDKMDSSCAAGSFFLYNFIHHLSHCFSGLQETLQHPSELQCWFSISISSISERERNLHHLQRPSDNGPHISFYSPSSTGLTNCDLDLALWHGSHSNREAKRHECYMILFYSGKLIVPPTPLPKCRGNRDCRFLSLEPLKTYNIWRLFFMHSVQGFCWSKNRP